MFAFDYSESIRVLFGFKNSNESMIEKIGDRVSVNLIYNHVAGTVLPRHIKWKNHIYAIEKLGLHYTLYKGNVLFHMFAVSNTDHYFLLAFNAQTLVWTLEEVADERTN